MNHMEHMTRQAAKAVGRDVSKMTWREKESVLVDGPYPLNVFPDQWTPEVFGPLVRPADAFTVESDLRLNVSYKLNIRTVLIIVTQDEPGDKMTSYMTSFPVTADRGMALAARMLAITQFASMLATLENNSHV